MNKTIVFLILLSTVATADAAESSIVDKILDAGRDYGEHRAREKRRDRQDERAERERRDRRDRQRERDRRADTRQHRR